MTETESTSRHLLEVVSELLAARHDQESVRMTVLECSDLIRGEALLAGSLGADWE